MAGQAPTLKWSVSGSLKAVAIKGATAQAKKAALLAEAETIMTQAKRDTPVDTGALRASGVVTMNGEVAELSFGGAASAYAVYVHEDLTAGHPVGKAKFLEDAVHDWEAKGGWNKVGARIAKAISGGPF